ncbi:hypothetical protein JCM10213_002639 [Rhodosporidiobolus nylandii]
MLGVRSLRVQAKKRISGVVERLSGGRKSRATERSRTSGGEAKEDSRVALYFTSPRPTLSHNNSSSAPPFCAYVPLDRERMYPRSPYALDPTFSRCATSAAAETLSLSLLEPTSSTSLASFTALEEGEPSTVDATSLTLFHLTTACELGRAYSLFLLTLSQRQSIFFACPSASSCPTVSSTPSSWAVDDRDGNTEDGDWTAASASEASFRCATAAEVERLNEEADDVG